MQKDLHEKPFDEGTIKKLDIFESYTKEWLPTFVMNEYEPELCIFDLFAGTGYSKTKQEGSAIRILKQVNNQIGNIFNRKKKIYLIFNELDKDKYQLLSEACDSFCKSHIDLQRAINEKLVQCKVINCDVAKIYPKVKNFIGKYPLLLFLDQNGIKFMADSYLLPLLNAKKVDFLLYLSSSYILRFGNTDEFQNIIHINIEQARISPYKYIHRSILEQLKKKIPSNSKTRLYPFTIKKNSNVYGIIFGSSHYRGVDKFLTTAWNENNINGEANFDIDDDCNKGYRDLFGNMEYTKIQKFKTDLRALVLNKEIRTNKEAYYYTLEQGHIPSHTSEEIKAMKKEKLIEYKSKSPLVNYQQVCKNKNIIEYSIL